MHLYAQEHKYELYCAHHHLFTSSLSFSLLTLSLFFQNVRQRTCLKFLLLPRQGEVGFVTRPWEVEVEAATLDGKLITRTFRGVEARIVVFLFILLFTGSSEPDVNSPNNYCF